MENWIQCLGTLIEIYEDEEKSKHYTFDFLHSQVSSNTNTKQIQFCFNATSPAWSFRDWYFCKPASIVLTSQTLPDIPLISKRFGIESAVQNHFDHVINIPNQVNKQTNLVHVHHSFKNW